MVAKRGPLQFVGELSTVASPNMPHEIWHTSIRAASDVAALLLTRECLRMLVSRVPETEIAMRACEPPLPLPGDACQYFRAWAVGMVFGSGGCVAWQPWCLSRGLCMLSFPVLRLLGVHVRCLQQGLDLDMSFDASPSWPPWVVWDQSAG